MPTPSEFELQRAFTIWLFGHNNSPRHLAPNVEAWHTPNGGLRRDAFEGKRLKQIGVLAGIHDYLFLRPTDFGVYGVFGLLFGLEFKKPGGTQPPSRHLSLAQLDVQPRLLRAGMAASCVVDNLADAREFCRKHSLTI